VHFVLIVALCKDLPLILEGVAWIGPALCVAHCGIDVLQFRPELVPFKAVVLQLDGLALVVCSQVGVAGTNFNV
jgi:hypothetical protein